MPRSPLTEVIKRAEGMVHYVQENLSAEEYALFLDMIDPLPEPEQKRAKKKSGKSASKSTRSKRTSGIGERLSSRRQEQRQVTTDSDSDSGDNGRCAFLLSDGTCGLLPDHNIHHLTNHPNHHSFQPLASTAEPPSTPASSGIDGDGVGDVHHAASSGD